MGVDKELLNNEGLTARQIDAQAQRGGMQP